MVTTVATGVDTGFRPAHVRLGEVMRGSSFLLYWILESTGGNPTAPGPPRSKQDGAVRNVPQHLRRNITLSNFMRRTSLTPTAIDERTT